MKTTLEMPGELGVDAALNFGRVDALELCIEFRVPVIKQVLSYKTQIEVFADVPPKPRINSGVGGSLQVGKVTHLIQRGIKLEIAGECEI